jgi:hypothetical protein
MNKCYRCPLPATANLQWGQAKEQTADCCDEHGRELWGELQKKYHQAAERIIITPRNNSQSDARSIG